MEIPRCFSISIQSEVVCLWLALARTAPARLDRAAVKEQLFRESRLARVRMREMIAKVRLRAISLFRALDMGCESARNTVRLPVLLCRSRLHIVNRLSRALRKTETIYGRKNGNSPLA